MSEKERDELFADLSAVMKKHDVCIMSSADADDDSNLRSWIEVCRLTKRPGRHPILETLIECDFIDQNGVEL